MSGALSTAEAAAWLTEHGLHPTGDLLRYSAKHVFTHIEWQMRVYAADVAGEGIRQFVRADGSQSIPTAFKVCLGKDADRNVNNR